MKKLKKLAAALGMAAIMLFGSCTASSPPQSTTLPPQTTVQITEAQEENTVQTEQTEQETTLAFSEDEPDTEAEEVKPEESEAQEAPTAEETEADEEEYVVYSFRNKDRYDEHYVKHGAEFGDITKEEYLQMANDLINSDSEAIEYKYDEDGDLMMYDKDNNYFLVLSTDGYIRTFFRPSAGISYWNRQ